MSYRINEIVSALSLREFADLRSLIDEHGPKITRLAGAGIEDVGGKLLQRKFNIVKIERTTYSLFVVVDLGYGIIRRCEVKGKTEGALLHAALDRVA